MQFQGPVILIGVIWPQMANEYFKNTSYTKKFCSVTFHDFFLQREDVRYSSRMTRNRFYFTFRQNNLYKRKTDAMIYLTWYLNLFVSSKMGCKLNWLLVKIKCFGRFKEFKHCHFPSSIIFRSPELLRWTLAMGWRPLSDNICFVSTTEPNLSLPNLVCSICRWRSQEGR